MDDRIDGLTYTTPSCPNCGANHWKYQEVPGHSNLRNRLVDARYALILVAISLATGAVLMSNAELTSKLGFICLGALLIVAPLIMAAGWLAHQIHAQLFVCHSCELVVEPGLLNPARFDA